MLDSMRQALKLSSGGINIIDLPYCSNLATDLREFVVRVYKVLRQLKSCGENIYQEMILIAIEKKLPRQVLIELKSDKEKRVGVNNEGELLGGTEQLLRDLDGYVKIKAETDALSIKEEKEIYKLREGGKKDFRAVVNNVKTNDVFRCCTLWTTAL
ncbi:unnamed protein product [Enterobius vermicularis]|uniref:Zeta_toxin domain-containing protein n=1 Tax=Enterobius vermicularis TaxID=51028 RepID=A0A0N4VIG3_ENTVE|nr:unnamed protein product [Enterobius vermicularis]